MYATSHFTACTNCGQVCRIEVVMPVVTLSDKRMVKFCPMCGTEWHYDGYANSQSFKLVAHHVVGRVPTDDEVALIEQLYPEWDATVHHTFKEFITALFRQPAS